MPPGRTPQSITGWGQHPVVSGFELCSEDLERTAARATLSRGLGRSYGDASLPAAPGQCVSSSVRADRLLAFDERSGVLRAEAGLSMDALIRIFLPRGFFPPVVAGTRYITLGGAVAADIHGKNHHLAGSLGQHVTALKLCLGSGQVIECSRNLHPDLFRATIGGVGLTGHIVEVELTLVRIPSRWIWCESEMVGDIDALSQRLKQAAQEWPFTFGLVNAGANSAKRYGMLVKGRWMQPTEAPVDVPHPPKPIHLPWRLMRLAEPFAAGALHTALFTLQPYRLRARAVSLYRFFFPLDLVSDWNKIYSPHGFTQYHCVIPAEAGITPIRDLLETNARAHVTPRLCVIKDCGPAGLGILSFPQLGLSLALDLPMRTWTQALVDRLNGIVAAAGGRIYLAKDALTRRADFLRMEPRLEQFLAIRSRWAPANAPASALFRRLMVTT